MALYLLVHQNVGKKMYHNDGNEYKVYGSVN